MSPQAAAPTVQDPPKTETETVGARERAPYLVFECPSDVLKPGDQITLVGRCLALDRTDARWKAVDDNDALAERVRVEGETCGERRDGVWLLAIPASRARPEMTVEEIVKTAVRR